MEEEEEEADVFSERELSIAHTRPTCSRRREEGRGGGGEEGERGRREDRKEREREEREEREEGEREEERGGQR